MKDLKISAMTLLSAAILFSGCGASNTTKGTVIGVGAGAAVGAGVGKVAGNTALGAVIGAAVGGATGAIIGKRMDKQKEELEKVDYNQTLSERRAKSVYDYLIDQGVNSRRMIYEGKGIHQPIADNSTVAGRAQNRRVEIIISANEKMVNEAKREAGE